MEIRSGVTAIFAAGAVVLPMLACKDAVAPAASSAIKVSVEVAGVFPSDRFTIELDGRSMTLLAAEGSLVVRSLSAGTHRLSLVGLPSSCRNDGVNPATVETSPANLSAVEFRVSCVAVTGAIAVAVTVVGGNVPVWFQADVDTLSARETVRGNATTVLHASFSGGTHVVRLSAVPSFCKPTSNLVGSVEVKTGAVLLDTAVASFNIECQAPEAEADTAASIVFERNGHVMTINESRGSTVVVTIGERPAWAPDGKLISFQRLNCDPSYECEHDLWLMSPDGRDQRTVSQDNVYDDFDAAISPSGAQIAFIRFVPGPDQTYLALSTLDGGSIKLLSMWYPYTTPSWSPDASDIAFVCQGTSGTSLALCLASTDEFCTIYFSNRCNWPAAVPITTSVGDELDPAWSRDGRRIAFTLACGGGLGNLPPSHVPCPEGVAVGDPYIAVIDIASREITRLVPGHDPAWSSDGSQLVFVGNAGTPGLRVYRFADGSVRQLTDNSLDTSPSWR